MDQDSAHMVAASKVPMLKLGEFELWRMRIEQYIQMIDYALWTLPKTTVVKDAKLLLEAIEKRFGRNAATKKTQRNLLKQQYENFTAPSSKMLNQILIGFKSLNKADLDTMSMDDLYNNLKVTNEAVNIAHGVSTASTQVNAANFTNIDNLSDAVICSFFSSQSNNPQLAYEDFPKWNATTATIGDILLGSVELQGIKTTRTRESSRRNVPIDTSIALVSCDGLGGYDWSDQAEEGPNYALMAFSSSSSDSRVFNDSNCLKTCMETIKLLKSQNDQLLRDLWKSSLMVLGYKIGLESVEEKLEFYIKNESVYVENINGLKWDIQVGDITIRELRKKLEKIQKEKDSIQFNVDKFENASNSLNKLIECQIVDNYKKVVNKLVVENIKSDEEVSKVVRKSDDSPIIEYWVSDREEENVSQTKTKKKTVKPSISKIKFVKPKQQKKIARKTVKQVEKHRQNTHSPRGNQRN
ncbi:hypothetical protein Tco_0348813 [Tanacetum coccineum]